MLKTCCILAIGLPLAFAPGTGPSSASAVSHNRFGRIDPPYQVGVASWYGPKFQGRETTSGEKYNMLAFTAAHPSLPLGTRVVVTNLCNDRSLTVRINDRGPNVAGRIIDLSYASARALGFKAAGLTTVRLDVLPRPPRVN